jgi:hypothetical protein
MAGVKASTLQNVLNSTPISGWVTAYGLDTTFLFGVLGGPVAKTGNFQWNVKTSGNTTAGSFAESATLSTAGAAGRDRVTGNIARYYATIAVDGLIEAKAAGQAYDQFNDILMEEADGAIEDILDDMNSDLITSGSVSDVNGVVYYNATSASLDSGGTVLTGTELAAVNAKYGDKTRAAYYSSYINTAATASLTFAMMDDVHQNLVDVRNSRYNQIWTSETQLMNYENLLRLSGSSVQYVDANVGDRRFKALLYAGRPVVGIPGYKNDRMDFVRSSDWEYWYVPQVSKDEQGREIKGIFKVEPISKTTDDTTFAVITYGNLVCKNPFKQGALIGLDSTIT